MSTIATLAIVRYHQKNPLKVVAPGATAWYIRRPADRSESNQADIKITAATVHGVSSSAVFLTISSRARRTVFNTPIVVS